MKLAVIAFTRRGSGLCMKLKQEFETKGWECRAYILERFLNPLYREAGLIPLSSTLGQWSKEMFQAQDGIIFIGAAGIAVRAIAPYVCDKGKDPAVVVIDECGRFSVSLLSGHIGGGNRLAEEAAFIAGAIPVVTTATDLRGIFSVDVFAAGGGYVMDGRETAKSISAELLDENPVGFYSDFPVDGKIPEGFTQKEICRFHVWITAQARIPEDSPLKLFCGSMSRVLRLIPPVLCVGIGCKRGTPYEELRYGMEQALAEANYAMEAVCGIASIQLKKQETGLLKLAKELCVEFCTYSNSVLEQVPGYFQDSEFVKEITGIGNVCERAACCMAGEQVKKKAMGAVFAGEVKLVVCKQKLAGMTIAVAMVPWRVRV